MRYFCNRCGEPASAHRCLAEHHGEVAAATLAERSRILALIRAKAEEWEDENRRVRDYGGTPVYEDEANAARELITLIEATDA